MRNQVAAVADAVGQGEPLHQAITRYPEQFGAVDLQTIAVSEKSGALDIGLLSLSQYHDARAQAHSKIRSASTFPALLLVAAVFISHIPKLVLSAMGQPSYSVTQFLIDTFGFLAFLVFLAFLITNSLRWPPRAPGANVAVNGSCAPSR